MARPITDLSFAIEELIDNYDQDFFNKVQNSTHCLLYLLPLLTLLITGLISDLEAIFSHFPLFKKALFKKSFVLHSLYKYK